MKLWLDYETAGTEDLEERGLDVYATSPDTRVILAAYSFDNNPVNLWQTHKSDIPNDLLDALYSDDVFIHAWNAQFERVITKWVLGIDIDPSRFRCSMVHAKYISLPGSLSECGEVLKLPQDSQKIKDGLRLINKFCFPARPGGEETLFGLSKPIFRDCDSDPEDWNKFCEYCKQDVVAEREIEKRLEKYPVPERECKLYSLDQKINDFGFPCDMQLVNNASWMSEKIHEELSQEQKDITKLHNPNSVKKLLPWLKERGYPYNTLNKNFVNIALAEFSSDMTPECIKVLELRKQNSKTFDTKFITLNNTVSSDGRLRYSLNFMGAERTGRWSGHGFQPQNLTRPNKEMEKRVDEAVKLIKENNFEAIRTDFESNPLDVISGCLRPSIKAPIGQRLVIADLSAIETRVGAWLSGCKPLLQVFLDKRDPYLDFACKLYNKSYEELERLYKEKDPFAKEMRQNAKPAILGAIFGLGGGDEVQTENGLIKTGLWGYAKALGIEITREFAHRSVEVFRTEYKEIKDFWDTLKYATMECVTTGQPREAGILRFEMLDDIMKMILPSGRCLHYISPRIEDKINVWKGREYKSLQLTYIGRDQKTHQFIRIPTHPGKILENADQAISRDILAEGLTRADDMGFSIVLHAHDEIVGSESKFTVEQLIDCMRKPIDWAPGLPLDAAGFSSIYYKKE